MGGMLSEIGVAKFLPDYLRHAFSPTVHAVVHFADEKGAAYRRDVEVFLELVNAYAMFRYQ